MCLGLVLAFTLSVLSGAADAETRFSGYLKNFTVVQEETSNDLIMLDTRYSSQFTGRLMLDGFSESFSWQVHYELASQLNSSLQPDLGFEATRNSYRLSDIKTRLGNEDGKTVTIQNLDRLNVQIPLNIGDLTVGRQPITFGSARVINPTDIFLPFNVQALNTEYRIGIDAVRMQMPIGQLSELDFGYVLGENQDQSAYFSRLKTNYSGSDFEVTGMRFSEQTMFGLGVESTLGIFGTWFEFSHVSADSTYNRTSFGLDYGFNENVFGMLEYHYSGAGSDDTETYLTQLEEVAYASGGVFLFGENYLIPSISWQASPLTNYSLQLLANLDDNSSFAIASFEHSLSDNFYLGASLFLFTGDDAELRTNGIDLGSEYGNNPNQFILNLRYYF